MNHNNVLILTPDRVGSTFLQRLLTILMNAHKYDRPVINLHELTNGIIRYFSPEYNSEILGKPERIDQPRGYHQTLSEITDLLSSVDHYKTSRLAQYHIRNRNDPIAQQVEFYKYLNEHFYIISAQRENLFEHALSWVIVTRSDKLNVYNPLDKADYYEDLYSIKIKVPRMSLIKYLQDYAKYLEWVDQYFTVGSYFVYEQDMPRAEEFCLELPCFNHQEKRNWNDIFGIEFEDWNRCHYLLGDISGLSKQVEPTLLLEDKSNKPNFQLSVPDDTSTRNGIIQSLSNTDQQYLLNNSKAYTKSFLAIKELTDRGALVTGMPIKLQTMAEKKLMIKNFDEVAGWYNEWVAENGIGKPYNSDDSAVKESEELRKWHCSQLLNSPTDQQNVQQLTDHSDDRPEQDLI
jgi:hypothetical protein